MSLSAMLALGFILGIRHATDSDHVAAVSTIVSREQSLRGAASIGLLWGLGHTLTLLLVGGAILAFGIVVPPRLGLGLELSVAIMLVVLGAVNVASFLRSSHPHSHDADRRRTWRRLRPLCVGGVHGLAGSAAVALLVLGSAPEVWLGTVYLLLFGAGTILGMLIITSALAMPLAAAASRFERVHGLLAIGTGIASVAFGTLLVYEIGFVQGLFTSNAHWTPH